VTRIDSHCIHTEAGPIHSTLYAHLAEKCKGELSVVCMLTTLGDEFERVIQRLDQLSAQYTVDAFGSEMVEEITDLLELEWKKRIRTDGLCSTRRFSPGYCDWDLVGQDMIFSALDASRISVKLNEYHVIIPSKSISAVAVIAREVPDETPCAFCRKQNCIWRRESHTD